jgi:ACS family hexuronate transporter-like MFS transporter
MLSTSKPSGSDAAQGVEQGPVMPPVGNYRWVICALLFFATTINYLDRQILGILAPTLGKEIGWDKVQFGYIQNAFQIAYAVGLLTSGWVMDKIGTRRGYSVAITLWSLAAVAHASATSVWSFAVARFALGIGEAGNFPAAIKTVAEWFPKRDRALVAGIFNSGSNIGAILAPIIVPWLTYQYSWKVAFVVTGSIGFIWLVAWLLLYRKPEEHPRVSQAELAYIRSDPPESVSPVRWLSLLRHRQLWAVAIGKGLTDPVWWFYLFWLGYFFDDRYNIDIKKISIPLAIIYLVADFGSIGGGWLSSFLIKRGASINFGRKMAMLICALCVTPVYFASTTSNIWVTVAFVSLAAAAHQGWSANIFTMASDMFPRRAVGSAVGFAGMAGSLASMVFTYYVSHLLKSNGNNYKPVFFLCGGAYLVALGIVHLLVPTLKSVDLDEPAAQTL